MTHNGNTSLPLAVLLAGLGSAFTVQATSFADGPVGEPEARIYHAQHLDRFVGDAPVFTAELASAALAQGRFDAMLAPGLPIRPADRQGEAQAASYYA